MVPKETYSTNFWCKINRSNKTIVSPTEVLLKIANEVSAVSF